MSYIGVNLMLQQPFGIGPCCMPCGNSFMLPSIFGGCTGLFGGNMFGAAMPGWNIFGGMDWFTPALEFGYIPPVNCMPVRLPTFNKVTYQPVSTLTPCSATVTNASFGSVTVKKTGKKSKKTKKASYNTNTNLPSLQEVGYNKNKAQKLAAEIAADSKEGGFDNLCAKHVKIAIQDAGLGSYQQGHGYQMADILKNNKNFKEIKVSGNDLSSLPAGCVLVYDRGVSGYSSKYGHTEITLGDGTAASGGITHNIRSGARVFVPV